LLRTLRSALTNPLHRKMQRVFLCAEDDNAQLRSSHGLC